MPTQRKLLNAEWRRHIQGHTGSEWRPEPRLPVFSFSSSRTSREAGFTNPAPASHLLPFSPLPPGLPETAGRVGQIEEAKHQRQALKLLDDWVTLCRLLNFSVPQFPPRWNEEIIALTSQGCRGDQTRCQVEKPSGTFLVGSDHLPWLLFWWCP